MLLGSNSMLTHFVERFGLSVRFSCRDNSDVFIVVTFIAVVQFKGMGNEQKQATVNL